MIQWPSPLIRDLARRKCIIVIGSGVSRHSAGTGGVRPPTWKTFLEAALADCPDKSNLDPVRSALDAEDLLHACEWLKVRFDEQWIVHLRKTFTEPAYKPADIHQVILDLDSRIVFSLNFDDIYERHVNGIHYGSHIVKSYHDDDVYEFLRGVSYYIIKVHGSLNNAQNTIFTQMEYSRARTKNLTFYQAFDAALLTHTFLFIGSGHNDPDINLLLENQNFSYPSHSPHYFLTGSKLSEDRKKSLRQNRNLKVIEYEPVDDEHSGLVLELKRLVDDVDSERALLYSQTKW